jgi:sec-independent protein translocase protein TatB
MFDIGFTEIVVIAVVALIVIGPERLPKTARTLGHLFGRLQRYVNDVKSDISREMELEELRKLQQEMKSAASDLESSMTAAARDVESGMRGVEAQLNAGASETPAPAPVQAAEFAAPSPTPSPSAEAHPPEPARQPSLPGFDKI